MIDKAFELEIKSKIEVKSFLKNLPKYFEIYSKTKNVVPFSSLLLEYDPTKKNRLEVEVCNQKQYAK